MQITQSASDGLKREYRVTVESSKMTERIDERLRELHSKGTFKGFRPGKMPMQLLRKLYGKDVREEVAGTTVKETVEDAIKQQGVRFSVPPRLESVSFDEGSDLEYVISGEILPDISIGDFSGYELEKHVIEAGDELLDMTVERLLGLMTRHLPIQDEDQGAVDGNLAAIAVRTAGHDAEDPGNDRYVTVGQDDEAWGELGRCLRGRRLGESFTAELAPPGDGTDDNGPGTRETCQVTVKNLFSVVEPAEGDEIMQSLGCETMDDLRSVAREAVDDTLRGLTRAQLKRKLLDRLAEDYAFDVPRTLVDMEFRSIAAATLLALSDETDRQAGEDQGREEVEADGDSGGNQGDHEDSPPEESRTADGDPGGNKGGYEDAPPGKPDGGWRSRREQGWLRGRTPGGKPDGGWRSGRESG